MFKVLKCIKRHIMYLDMFMLCLATARLNFVVILKDPNMYCMSFVAWHFSLVRNVKEIVHGVYLCI